MRRLSSTRLTALACALVLVALACTAIVVSSPHPVLSQASGTPITGWAWSDTIGWISLSGNGYGLSIDGSGNVTGDAWSDNVGWISANPSDLSSCPGQTSQIQNGVWTGWLRALSGGTTGSGGWDGCISLSGSSPAYGVTLSGSTGDFSGYAWGDTNVGWVDFEYAQTTVQCQDLVGQKFCGTGSASTTIYQSDNLGNQCQISTCAYECSNGACVAPPLPGPGPGGTAITVSPSIVAPDATTTVSWDVEYVSACTVVGSNGDGANGSWSGASGSETSSPITQQTAYTLTCTGTYGGTFTQSATVDVTPSFKEI